MLVRCGLLPGPPFSGAVTLAHNDSGRFEARWIRLLPRPGRSPFVTFTEPIELPVAHGEGKFLTAQAETTRALDDAGQIVLQYAGPDDRPTMDYPANPNGSVLAAAGVCDSTGRIFGLMPHPERFALAIHHPRWTRQTNGPSATEGHGLRLFKSAVASLA